MHNIIFLGQEIMQLDKILKILEQHKAKDIVTLDIKDMSDMADTMIICTGTSGTHILGIAKKIVLAAKEPNQKPPHAEATEYGEWVLIDLGDIIINIMKQETRDYYKLEDLWQQ